MGHHGALLSAKRRGNVKARTGGLALLPHSLCPLHRSLPHLNPLCTLTLRGSSCGGARVRLMLQNIKPRVRRSRGVPGAASASLEMLLGPFPGLEFVSPTQRHKDFADRASFQSSVITSDMPLVRGWGWEEAGKLQQPFTFLPRPRRTPQLLPPAPSCSQGHPQAKPTHPTPQ